MIFRELQRLQADIAELGNLFAQVGEGNADLRAALKRMSKLNEDLRDELRQSKARERLLHGLLAGVLGHGPNGPRINEFEEIIEQTYASHGVGGST